MSNAPSRPHRLLVASALTLGLTLPGLARAQGVDSASAEILFQEGRALLEGGNATEACPKLAASYQLDPATGTLLALALCYEADGKLASAWAAFRQVEARAVKANDSTRQALAQQKSQELEPLLSTVVVEVSEEVAAVPGLEVTRNGTPLQRGTWNVALPMDGGTHLIEATAPGRKDWAAEVSLAASGARERLAVPMLENLAEPTPRPSELTETGRRADPVDVEPDASYFATFTTPRWAGVAAAGAGVVSLGIGGYFLSEGVAKHEQSTPYCQGDACTETGRTLRRDANANGDLATAFSIGGGVLLGTGVVLFLAGAPDTATGGGPAFSVAIGRDGSTGTMALQF